MEALNYLSIYNHLVYGDWIEPTSNEGQFIESFQIYTKALPRNITEKDCSPFFSSVSKLTPYESLRDHWCKLIIASYRDTFGVEKTNCLRLESRTKKKAS